MSNQILQTKDYSQFRVSLYNRELNERHIQKLIKSIEANNLLALNPIIVNSQMEVVDGQHRLEAASRLNLPIYYVQLGDDSTGVIATLNATQKAWGLVEFVKFYAKHGKPNYIRLKQLMDKTGFSVGDVFACVKGYGISGNRSATIKDGHLSFPDEYRASVEKIFDYIQIFAHLPFRRESRFIRAFAEVMATKGYIQQRMAKQIEHYPEGITRQLSQSEYVAALKRLYNHGLKGNSRLE